MSDTLTIKLKKVAGHVVQDHWPRSKTNLWVRFFGVALARLTVPQLSNRQIVAVSSNIAQLTRVTALEIDTNALTAFPAAVFLMTQLTFVNLRQNRMSVIPREISLLTALTALYVDDNQIASVPREIGKLRALGTLGLSNNPLKSLPSEIGLLSALTTLYLGRCQLSWLPISFDRLPSSAVIYLESNPLPSAGDSNWASWSRRRLPELFAATSHVFAAIRDSAADVLVALQALFIPALLLVEILDAAFPNSVPMHKKWDLVVAVKHFHQRRGIER